ncbi:MAG TPA: PilN domain-containing protein [Phycisphaerae bacterium]|nr:PilN domain-containing protein [Phycisphaerae bacterium]HRW53688.1 PilN domain-containing protein [Phycisphaerae bacterium]
MVSRDCDFIPAEYHERRRVRGMVRQRVASIVGIFSIMLVWVGAHYYQISSAEAMMQDVAAQKAQMESLATRKAEMEQARTALTNLQDLMRELAGERSLVSVFGELSQRIPDSIVLTGIQMYEPSMSEYAVETGKQSAMAQAPVSRRNPRATRTEPMAPTLTEIESMRRGLTLYGVARSIPDIIDFAAALDKSPAFFEVDMDVREPTMYAGRAARRFRMTCRMAQEAAPKR